MLDIYTTMKLPHRTTKNQSPTITVKRNNQLEDPFAQYLTFCNINYIRQYAPFKERRYRCDFYLPDYNTIIEIEGGQYIGGRHTRGKGFQNDIEKYNKITLAGFKVLRLTTNHFQKIGVNQFACVGYAAKLLEEVINGKN